MTDAVRTVHNRPTSAPVRRTRIPQGLQGFDKGNEAALGREDGRGRIPMFHVLSRVVPCAHSYNTCARALGVGALQVSEGGAARRPVLVGTASPSSKELRVRPSIRSHMLRLRWRGRSRGWFRE